MAAKICVAVRKRPCGTEDKDVVNCTTPSLTVNEPKIKYDLTPYTDKHNFVFDQVFDERTNNREVYNRCAAPLIDTVFSKGGGTATCFAYGQTGSGKTHTMLGKRDEPGLYMCAAHDLFIRANQVGAVVFASFYEIYGRKLFDLLNDRAKLVCREDGDKVIQICGLTEHPVGKVEHLLEIIDAGNGLRAAGSTSANSESSRSHAVLTLDVREVKDQKQVGKISFIDLAGNERGSDSFDSDRKTRIEGAEINKSLLALKECIRALGMGKSHVPFRGSILTEVLRDSFLGNSRTTMIATISATAQNCENTLNTLRYTSRVKDLGPSAKGGGGGGNKAAREQAAQQQAAAQQQQANNEQQQQMVANLYRDVHNQQQNNNNNNNNQNKGRAAALAERLASDAAAAQQRGAGGSNNSSGVLPPLGSNEMVPSRISGNKGGAVVGGKDGNNSKQQQGSGAAVKEVPKQGRRAGQQQQGGVGGRSNSLAAADVSAQQQQQQQQRKPRPSWDQNFHKQDGGGSNKGAAGGAGKNVPLDPRVATIVEAHISQVDEIDAEAGGSDSEGSDGDNDNNAGDNNALVDDVVGGAHHHNVGNREGLGSSLRKVRAVHAHIVSRIRASEENVINVHRKHVDHKMTMMKHEVAALQSLDDNGSIDEYVEKVDALLANEVREIQAMRDRLTKINTYLKEEEVLSKTLTPAGKKVRPNF